MNDLPVAIGTSDSVLASGCAASAITSSGIGACAWNSGSLSGRPSFSLPSFSSLSLSLSLKSILSFDSFPSFSLNLVVLVDDPAGLVGGTDRAADLPCSEVARQQERHALSSYQTIWRSIRLK